MSKPKLAPWKDADVQRIYEILCDELKHKPSSQHWEGYCARWIAGELMAPLRKKLSKLERQGARK